MHKKTRRKLYSLTDLWNLKESIISFTKSSIKRLDILMKIEKKYYYENTKIISF